MRRGNLTFDERLSAKDPAAAATKSIGEAQVKATAEAQKDRNALGLAEVKQRGESSQSRDKALVEAAKIKAGVEAGGATTTAGKIAEARTGIEEAKTPKEAEVHIANAPKEMQDTLRKEWEAKQNVARAEANRPDSFWEKLNQSAAYQTGIPQAADAIGLSAKSKIKAPVKVNPKQIRPEHLVPAAGDTPAQLKIKAEFRKKYPGLRTQLEAKGKLKPGK
jgi:hypothetical protein